MNGHRFALTLGLGFAAFHAFWAALVATGFAQPLIDFIFWAHFITPPYTIEAFEPARAAILVGVTGFVGYLSGWVLALVWALLSPRAA